MIKYRMICSAGHESDIWFRGSEACAAQLEARQVICPECGDDQMSKALMAPRIATPSATRKAPEPEAAPAAPAAHPPAGGPAAAAGRMALTSEAMRREIEGRLRALRAHVEATAENVGDAFATEARAIHEGEAEERPIYGQCDPDDARDLIEEGVPVLPLPWVDRQDD